MNFYMVQVLRYCYNMKLQIVQVLRYRYNIIMMLEKDKGAQLGGGRGQKASP